MKVDERKSLNKEIKRSARNDYRSHVDKIATDIEAADRVGDTTSVHKFAKVLTLKGNGNKFCQPSTDNDGNLITSTEQQLESWAVFLEKKFSARPGETVPDLEDRPDDDVVPELSIEETELCLKSTKSGKLRVQMRYLQSYTETRPRLKSYTMSCNKSLIQRTFLLISYLARC